MTKSRLLFFSRGVIQYYRSPPYPCRSRHLLLVDGKSDDASLSEYTRTRSRSRHLLLVDGKSDDASLSEYTRTRIGNRLKRSYTRLG